MGREIRMVPPNWEHPKMVNGSHPERKQPMYDRNFADAKKVWIAGLLEWESNNKSETEECEYWEWEGDPPDRAYCRPWKDEEATWVQVWETVSEGTPVSPPFATRAELVEYLVQYGDYWDQLRTDEPWDREAAERFCGEGGGYAPSMTMVGGRVFKPGDNLP